MEILFIEQQVGKAKILFIEHQLGKGKIFRSFFYSIVYTYIYINIGQKSSL